MEISILRTTNPKTKPKRDELGFGVFTDHMFLFNYQEGKGWHNPRIVPYGPLALDPGAIVLHYSQTVFEGMKAYAGSRGRVLLFRPEANMQRLNSSCERMCIPAIDELFMVEAIKKLVAIEQDWIPTDPGTSLYIRPLIIATEPYLGVRASSSYTLAVILAPVGSYFPQGLKPVSIYVEPHYVRAIRGGTGYIKTGGNYGVAFKAQSEAEESGHGQVLWLDGIERKYVEEVGAMNVFFRIGDTVVTPELGDTILPGITRNSVLHLLKAWGLPVAERRLPIEELVMAHKRGTLVEAFGSGTAAVIAPIGRLAWGEETIEINRGEIGTLSQRLYDTITGMQTGVLTDEYGWTVEVDIGN